MIEASARTDFYGALGSMIGGVGTTFAFLLGVWVLLDDRRRRRRIEADDAVAQARLVSILWKDTDRAGFPTAAFGVAGPVGALKAYDVRVANDSDLPVKEVIVAAIFPGKKRVITGEARIPHIGPRSTASVPWTVEMSAATPASEVELPAGLSMPSISMHFMDARGRFWSRDLHREPGRFFFDEPQSWANRTFTTARSWVQKRVRKQPKPT